MEFATIESGNTEKKPENGLQDTCKNFSKNVEERLCGLV